MAKGAMPKDGMNKEQMATARGSMSRDCPDAMGKGAMRQDGMGKDAMKK
jgi:pentapeptide MXKDX repeat protein